MGWRILPLLLLLFCFSASTARADGFLLLEWQGHKVKWGDPTYGEKARVTWAVTDRARSFTGATNCGAMEPVDRMLARAKISRAAFLTEIRMALARWEAVADIRFVPVANPADADIVIGAQARPRGVAYANVWRHDAARGQIARLRKAAICFNPLERWEAGLDGARDTYSVRRVTTHEIGHAIGLDHPGPRGQLMGFIYTEESDRLESGDEAGAVRLYGPPVR